MNLVQALAVTHAVLNTRLRQTLADETVLPMRERAILAATTAVMLAEINPQADRNLIFAHAAQMWCVSSPERKKVRRILRHAFA